MLFWNSRADTSRRLYFVVLREDGGDGTESTGSDYSDCWKSDDMCRMVCGIWYVSSSSVNCILFCCCCEGDENLPFLRGGFIDLAELFFLKLLVCSMYANCTISKMLFIIEYQQWIF